MATACLNKNGSSAGPSAKFHVCAQLGYGTAYNFGYPMYRRYYVQVTTGQSSNFTSNLTVSWTSTKYALNKAGSYASTGWVSLGNKTCGTSVSLSSVNCYYTGGSGTTYKSTSSAGSWTVPKASHTVAYNMNGGSGSISSQTKTYGTALTLSSTKPTRTGYTFLGWSTSSSATSATYSAGGSYTSDKWGGTVTLYAVWKVNTYTLHMYPEGGTWNGSTANQDISVNYNATASIPVPTRTGYTFGGWIWTTYGTMTNSIFACSAMSSTAHGISVYNNASNDSVTHSYNSSGSKPTYDVGVMTITKSTATASPGLGGFYRQVTPAYSTTYIHVFYAKLPTGYYFSYHNNAQPTGSTFTWLTDTAGTGDWKLYAYKLVTGSSGDTKTFGFIAANSNSGGSTASVTWYLGANQVTKSPTSAQTFTATAGNTWMFAAWIPNRYTVTYNANGGSGSMSTSTATYDANFVTRQNTFTKTGHNFNGWNEAADGSGTPWLLTSAGVYENNQTPWKWSGSAYAKNITLYAQWTPWQHTVTYNGNASGVTNLPSNQTKTYGSTLTLSTTKPVRAGYLFQGWSTTANGQVEYAPGATYGLDQNGGSKTLYAVWIVATKIGMSLTANTSGYTISNTSDGLANLPDLTINFTLTTVTENSNLNFYYRPYYLVGENKVYFTSNNLGGVTPSSIANKGSFILTGEQIKNYIINTENYNTITIGVDTWTAEITNDTKDNIASYSVAINNYTLPWVDILTAYRTSSSTVRVRVQVDYPACYSINVSTCKPTLSFNNVTLTTSGGAEKFNTRGIYSYDLSGVSGAGSLQATYTDGLFSSTSTRRIAATLEEQEFEVQEDMIYALEFIEN